MPDIIHVLAKWFIAIIIAMALFSPFISDAEAGITAEQHRQICGFVTEDVVLATTELNAGRAKEAVEVILLLKIGKQFPYAFTSKQLDELESFRNDIMKVAVASNLLMSFSKTKAEKAAFIELMKKGIYEGCFLANPNDFK